MKILLLALALLFVACKTSIAAPKVLAHPATQTLISGDALHLSALFSGDGALAYQWYKDGAALPGEVASVLVVESAAPEDSGNYTAKATTAEGSATTHVAYVRVASTAETENFAWIQLRGAFAPTGPIQFANGKFLASQDGDVLHSTDGLHWHRSAIKGESWIKSVALGEGRYVALASTGIHVSTDLTVWKRSAAALNPTSSIAYGAGTFVATSFDGIYVSPDGDTWTKAWEVDPAWGGLGFGGGEFIVTSSSGTYASDDGNVWTKRSDSSVYGDTLVHAGGTWWLYSRGTGYSIHRSADGVAWVTTELPNDEYHSFAVDPVTGDAYLVSRKEGPYSSVFVEELYQWAEDHWQFLQPLTYMSDDAAAVAAYGGRIIVHDRRGVIDIEDFDIDAPEPLPSWWTSTEISYANGQFLASSIDGLRASIDGTNWKLARAKQAEQPTFGKLAHGNGIYVGNFYAGIALGGLQPHGKSFERVAFGGGVFVGSASDGLWQSTDGFKWTQSAANGFGFPQIVYGNGRFVAMSNARIAVSTDGSEWTIYSNENSSFDTLSFGDGAFVAFDGDLSHRSTDGFYWAVGKRAFVPGMGAIETVVYFHGQFVAQSSAGQLFTSSDGVNWSPANAVAPGHGAPYNALPTLTAGDNALLSLSDFGFSIVGNAPTTRIVARFISPSGEIAASVGARTEVRVSAHSNAAPISEIVVHANGGIYTQLEGNERSFHFVSNEPGYTTLQIVAKDEAGSTSIDSIVVRTVPNIFTTRPVGEFQLHDLIYHNGAFYGAADGGKVYVSANGKDWKGIQTPVASRLSTIAATDAGIAIGHIGHGILFSPDGINWTNYEFASGPVQAWNGIFVVNGESGEHYLSIDGRSWFSSVTGEAVFGDGSNIAPFPVVYCDWHFGSYVGGPGWKSKALRMPGDYARSSAESAAGLGSAYIALDSPDVYRSVDLENWQKIDALHDSVDEIVRVGDRIFAAQFGRNLRVTADGELWHDLSDLNLSLPVARWEGKYYALQTIYYPFQLRWMESPDCVTWTPFGDPFETDSYSFSIAAVAASPMGVAATTQSGFEITGYSFTESGKPPQYARAASSGSLNNLRVVGIDRLFAISSTDTYAFEDGAWNRRQPRLPSNTVYANGVFLTAGNQGSLRSEEGDTWQPAPPPSWAGGDSSILTYFSESEKGFWLHAWSSGQTATFGRSVDGLTWTQKTLPPGFIQSHKPILSFNGDLYLTTDQSGDSTLYRSKDEGDSWELAIDDSFHPFAIAATSSRMAAFSRIGAQTITAIVTEDGENWSPATAPENGDINILATKDAFFAAGDSLWTSADAQNWTRILPYEVTAASNGESIFIFTDNFTSIERSVTDLELVAIEFASKEYGVGDSVEATVALQNNGPADLSLAEGSKLHLILSRRFGAWTLDPAESGATADLLLHETNIPAGATTHATGSLSIPPGVQPGAYFLAAALQGEAVFKDGNPSNDFAFSPTPAILIPQRQLTTAVVGMGELSVGGIARAWKDSVSIHATPAEGWGFSRWEEYPQVAGPDLTVQLDANATVTARFGVPYAKWAEARFPEATDNLAALDDADGDGILNIEDYVLGREFQHEAGTRPLGVRIENGLLINAYSLYRYPVGYGVEAVASFDASLWSSEEVTTVKVADTESLEIFESKVTLPAGDHPALIGVRISQNQ